MKIKALAITAAISFLTGVIAVPSAQAKGTIGGGGGNLCYRNGEVFLLDFSPIANRKSVPGVRTAISEPFFDLFGYAEDFSTFVSGPSWVEEQPTDHILSDPRLRLRVEEILKQNVGFSPKLVKMLEVSLRLQRYLLTTNTIRVPYNASMDPKNGCDSSNVRASMIHTVGGNVWLDLKKWNSLDLDSQAGLLFHENLRFLQILFNSMVAARSAVNPASSFSKAKSAKAPSLAPSFTDADLQLIVRNMFYKPQKFDSSALVSELSDFPDSVIFGYWDGNYDQFQDPICNGAVRKEFYGLQKDLYTLCTYEASAVQPSVARDALVKTRAKVLVKYNEYQTDELKKVLEDIDFLSERLAKNPLPFMRETVERVARSMGEMMETIPGQSSVDPIQENDFDRDERGWARKAGKIKMLYENDHHQYDTLICNIRENIRAFVATADSTALSSTEAIEAKNPLCQNKN